MSLIKYIKRYFAARAICKRYGFKFTPSLERHRGAMLYSGEIVVSILHDMFWEIFWHEVGHVVDYNIRGILDKKLKFAYISPFNLHESYYGCSSKDAEIISCEVQATRFALKMLKKTGTYTDQSRDFLLGQQALASYFGKTDWQEPWLVKMYAKAVKRTGARYD